MKNAPAILPPNFSGVGYCAHLLNPDSEIKLAGEEGRCQSCGAAELPLWWIEHNSGEAYEACEFCIREHADDFLCTLK